MANTNRLKNEIEPALLDSFRKTKGITGIEPSKAVRQHLGGMKFDGIGICEQNHELVFCEATTSGFLGGRDRDFHTGGVRKLADTFARFSIVMHRSVQKKLLAAAARDCGRPLKRIKCYLVVPEGCRFVEAIGYRKKWLEMGVMELATVKLPPSKRVILLQALGDARSEMTENRSRHRVPD